MATSKKKPTKMTQDDLIGKYLEILERCMEGDAKSFDARGAENALEQIGKLLGLSAPTKEASGVEIKLSKEASALGE